MDDARDGGDMYTSLGIASLISSLSMSHVITETRISKCTVKSFVAPTPLESYAFAMRMSASLTINVLINYRFIAFHARRHVSSMGVFAEIHPEICNAF